jgi:hypothetical protein
VHLIGQFSVSEDGEKPSEHVKAGLDPAIHENKPVDTRVKPGDDG